MAGKCLEATIVLTMSSGCGFPAIGSAWRTKDEACGVPHMYTCIHLRSQRDEDRPVFGFRCAHCCPCPSPLPVCATTDRLQGTPIDMPYLDGFPPKDELPSLSWTAKVVTSLVRTILGSVRYAKIRTSQPNLQVCRMGLWVWT